MKTFLKICTVIVALPILAALIRGPVDVEVVVEPATLTLEQEICESAVPDYAAEYYGRKYAKMILGRAGLDSQYFNYDHVVVAPKEVFGRDCAFLVRVDDELTGQIAFAFLFRWTGPKINDFQFVKRI